MRRLFATVNSPRWDGLVVNVTIVWAALGASLGLLSAAGGEFGSGAVDPPGAPWTPQRAVIGAVWSGLYTLMGLALWAVNRAPIGARGGSKAAILLLIGFCLVWPSYAFGTSNRWPGLLGNLGILGLAAFAMWRLQSHSRLAALMVAPVAVWITVTTASILDGAARYGW